MILEEPIRKYVKEFLEPLILVLFQLNGSHETGMQKLWEIRIGPIIQKRYNN